MAILAAQTWATEHGHEAAAESVFRRFVEFMACHYPEASRGRRRMNRRLPIEEVRIMKGNALREGGWTSKICGWTFGNLRFTCKTKNTKLA